jgi:osomolarity two-component system sensor histidine kinase SLN1
MHSKNEMGQSLSLEEKEFRLCDIGSQVLAIFGQQAKEGGITLSVKSEGLCDVELHEEGQPTGRTDMRLSESESVENMLLYGDEHRIVQIVLNLVSNSLKFTPAGGSVTVTARYRGEVHISGVRRASVQSRRGSVPSPTSRIHAAANANVSSSSDGPSTGRPNSEHPPRVARHWALTPPSELWLSFEFEVADTGPGIPEHLHSKIFEPFVQGDLGLNKKYGGTGLGLSICSQLAGLMRGTMEVRSEVGHGSVFVLSIPLRHVGGRGIATANTDVDLGTMTLPSRDRHLHSPLDSQPSGGAHSMQPIQASSGATLRYGSPLSAARATVVSDTLSEPCMVGLSQPPFAPATYPEQSISRATPVERVEAETTKHRRTIKVLVAEDNSTNQEVMMRILKLEDVHDVTVAADGQEALDRVRESLQNLDPYDLVFMDVQMPNLDGLQATRLIRQSGFTAPIVALTAYTEVSFYGPS